MRLNALDITRYGKFTDHVIDFAKPVAGEPDLHIIYGPNEAGKSTAFAAFLDLLFGIEAQPVQLHSPLFGDADRRVSGHRRWRV